MFPRSPTPCTTSGLLTDAPLGFEKAMTSDLLLPLLCLLKTLQLGAPFHVTQVLFWCDKLLWRTPYPPPQPSDLPRVLTLSWGPNSRGSPSPPPPFSKPSSLASPSPALPEHSYNGNEWLNCLWWSKRQGSPLNPPKGMNSLCPSIAWRLPGERERESERQRDRKHQRPRVA